MLCPRCRADNRAGRRFCSGCGGSLAAPCAACGFANEPGEKFCGGCGAALTPMTAAEVEAQPQSKATPAGERRQVTVVYVDLAGYSKLSRAIDPEEMQRLLNRFFDVVDGLIKSFGGAIDKHIGDAVMAVFGAPVAHGNDPERAVRAAVAVQAAMAGLSRDVGHTLQVHIGIASGLVVASGVGSDAHREYTVTGETVNLAARLDSLAETGETLIADAVYRAVAGMADCEPRGEIAVKGWDQPVRVWRLRALRAGGAVRPRSLFVGREAELGQLASLIATCRKTGHGQTVLVRGEAGIGKTRLVEEIAAEAERADFICYRAQVLDFGVGTGREAIRVVVASLLGVPLGGAEQARRQAADAAVADGLIAAEQRVFLNDLLDVPQPTELKALFDAMSAATRQNGRQQTVAGLIRQASARRPIFLVVEDIHWAGRVMLAYLAAIAAAIGDCPAILVLTSRIENDPIDQAWRGAARGSRFLAIDLAPLQRQEALALAAAFLDTSNRLAADCVERADGNPMFLEQLLRNVEESHDEAVPASIQSLVLARLDRLPPADKQALLTASILGQRFALDVLRHLLGDAAYTCNGLIEHFLIRPDGEDYMFDHAMIQEAVYLSLLHARRRDLHRKAAEWFAIRDLILRAEHLERAEDEAAAEAFLAAAQKQLQEYRYERALQLVKRGLGVARARPVKYRLTCLQGDIVRDTGMTERSIEVFRGALELADAAIDTCRAQIGLAAGYRVLDRYDEALTALSAAEATANGSARELGLIHYYRGNIYFALGRIDDCRDQHALALRHARDIGSAEAEARALSGLGDAAYLHGRMVTANDYFRRCVDLAHVNGFGAIEVANRAMVGHTRQYLNEIEAALADGVAAAETAAKVGQSRAEMMGRYLTCTVLFEMNDVARAKAQVELALALAEQLGARRFQAQHRLFLGQIAAAEGRRDEARDAMRQALAISQAVGHRFVGPRILARMAVCCDDAVERRHHLAEGEAMLGPNSISHNFFWFYRDAIEASLADGAWDEALRYAQALADYTRAEPLPWCDFFIARGGTLAAFGRGTRTPELLAELQRLRDEAERVALRAALPALDQALAAQAAA